MSIDEFISKHRGELLELYTPKGSPVVELLKRLGEDHLKSVYQAYNILLRIAEAQGIEGEFAGYYENALHSFEEPVPHSSWPDSKVFAIVAARAAKLARLAFEQEALEDQIASHATGRNPEEQLQNLLQYAVSLHKALSISAPSHLELLESATNYYEGRSATDDEERPVPEIMADWACTLLGGR